MKIVIQCAGSKTLNAGTLKTSDGRDVKFVAHPDKAADLSGYYAHPDDGNPTWREELVKYNATGNNPNNLCQAYQLYTSPAYHCLASKFGVENLYILSAGWGLITASFLTPDYDITFSNSAKPYAKRRKHPIYNDFNHLPDDGEKTIFIGGKDYQKFFCNLTKNHKGEKVVFYNSQNEPKLPSKFEPRLYETTLRTNWHYECAHALANGMLPL